MKNAVVTLCIGDEFKKLSELTHPIIKKYADKIGADFINLDSQRLSTSTPHWEKFRIFNLLEDYERIIYLDTDVIIREDCPNLFEIVPESQLGMFNEAPYTDRGKELMADICRLYEIKLDKWNGKYYNSGVMVISQVHKHLFRKPVKEYANFYEQSYLNMKIAEAVNNEEIEMFELDYEYNRMTCMDLFTGEERHASYIIHYAGCPQMSQVLSLIPKDLEKWENDKGTYKYLRHIHINVNGGMGDQICAEPAIRYLKKNLYPNDDVVVSTHFPTLFRHLGVPVYKHGNFKGTADVPYFRMNSLPGPETVNWSVVSHILCHSVDYCAMALLKRILPVKEKCLKLEANSNAISSVEEMIKPHNIKDLVLVHPGRHWNSKTFPVDFWQEIIDGLTAQGLKVAIIGKDEKDIGTVKVRKKNGELDLRNAMTVDELVAIISQAKIVISNDGVFETGHISTPGINIGRLRFCPPKTVQCFIFETTEITSETSW
jgi:hypothetical protein